MGVKHKFVFIVSILFLSCVLTQAQVTKTRLVNVGPGWSRTMVNAVIFRYNAVVSHNGYQYVAYYDSTATVTLAKRKLDDDQWIIKKTSYKGNASDAHNVITIMVDGAGYLHMAWDHHNSSLNYCKSLQPESLEMGERQAMIGRDEKSVTYPEFYRMPSGNLIFAYRDGKSGSGNLVMNQYDVKSGKWNRLHDAIIDGESRRNAYWQIYISQSGAIHLSWVWRETYNVETNHDMCYAVSSDGGRTWKKSNGQQYKLPIREATAEYAARIPQNSALINQTSITADEDDNPYIATYFRGSNDSCPQYYVIARQKDKWIVSKASSRTLNFELGGMGSRSIPISRPQLLYRKHKGEKELFIIYRDDERMDRVVMAHGNLHTGIWKTTDITQYPLIRWEPCYDTELWKSKKMLHIFLQKVGQESEEKAVDIPAQPVKILEVFIE